MDEVIIIRDTIIVQIDGSHVHIVVLHDMHIDWVRNICIRDDIGDGIMCQTVYGHEMYVDEVFRVMR